MISYLTLAAIAAVLALLRIAASRDRAHRPAAEEQEPIGIVKAAGATSRSRPALRIDGSTYALIDYDTHARTARLERVGYARAQPGLHPRPVPDPGVIGNTIDLR